MKLNNKGFSLVEIIAVIVVLGILLTVAIGEYNKYYIQSLEKSYDMFAHSIGSAAEEYIMDHPTAKNVTIDKLYEENYLESIADPANDDKDCAGKVVINKVKAENSTSLDYNNYSVSICCDKYEYTYKLPKGEKFKDKYCKVYPYDITKITDIKVLNVFPHTNYENNVKNWMNSYGKGIIHVTPVHIDNFNSSPNEYLGKDGNWNYDVVVFGFCDSYNSKDLNANSAKAVDEYLQNGGAVIFGHDTIAKAHTYFDSLAKYVNVETYSPYTWEARDKITIRKKGIFTTYPYEIGDEGTVLTIPPSHMSGQIAHADVWLGYNDISPDEKSVYLTTYGNNAFIQIGHSSGKATEDEQKILTNVIFYTVAKQYVEDEE